MLDFIERLQKQPYETRVKILWWTTAVLAVILIFVWIVSLKSTIKNTTGGPILPDTTTPAGASKLTNDYVTVERVESTATAFKIYFNLNNPTDDILNIPQAGNITLSAGQGKIHPTSILDRQDQPFVQKVLSHTQVFGTLTFGPLTEKTGTLTFDQMFLDKQPDQMLKQELPLDFMKLNQPTNVRS